MKISEYIYIYTYYTYVHTYDTCINFILFVRFNYFTLAFFTQKFKQSFSIFAVAVKRCEQSIRPSQL